ncbi:MAG: helix-turn-helix transcriptional regulator [Verrucomicrobia bacterium]|nr:helix-turn-helix transcriptional regulator [Verrucomicrobiota bacterium]MDA1087667.1 helix-turn-helix transcriptional regulator [Verrucomicrobiota bacterium]
MSTLGEILREEREKAGLTHSQVAEETRIKVQLIEGLENDDFSHIAATIYGKGFVRLYAELLKLDSQPLVDLYMEQAGESPPPDLKTKGRRRQAGADRVAGESMAAGDRRQILDEQGGGASGQRATRRQGNERRMPGIFAPVRAVAARLVAALPLSSKAPEGGDAEGSAQALQRAVLANWPMLLTLVLVLILIASSVSRCVRGVDPDGTGVSTVVRPLPFAEEPPEPLMD